MQSLVVTRARVVVVAPTKVFSNPGVGYTSVVLGKMRASRMRERLGGPQSVEMKTTWVRCCLCAALGQRVKLREKAKRHEGCAPRWSRALFRIFHAISAT
jgi:hypothetical protein